MVQQHFLRTQTFALSCFHYFIKLINEKKNVSKENLKYACACPLGY